MLLGANTHAACVLHLEEKKIWTTQAHRCVYNVHLYLQENRFASTSSNVHSYAVAVATATATAMMSLESPNTR